MRVNLETKPGQAASGHKPTISEVLAEYLRAEKSRLAPKTYARYANVIELFTHSLNSYAANSLNQFERARFDKHFDAEGDQHREFCDIFGPEHILENVGEFLNYFMVRKVIVGTDTLRAAGAVMKKLAKWLVEQGYAKSDDANLAIEQGSDRRIGIAQRLPNERVIGIIFLERIPKYVPQIVKVIEPDVNVIPGFTINESGESLRFFGEI